MKTLNTATFTKSLLTTLIILAGLTKTSAQEQARVNTLPALLMSFSAANNNNAGELAWTMENQTSCKWFVIERSATANGFDSIGVVAGTNNTHSTDYTFSDNHMLSGNNYYRLRQVDMDGVSKYSKIVCVYNANIAVADKKIQLYPNPATATLNYTLNSPAAARATVMVYTMSGLLVINQQQELEGGVNQQSLAISNLKSGNYFLKVVSQNGTQYDQSFVKL
ncbi:MAG TPA: T9SS type A sorting domain-containing protein [Puia sp.]|nr:T9SS type A sorting domain-containing protein [Puia sp.]